MNEDKMAYSISRYVCRKLLESFPNLKEHKFKSLFIFTDLDSDNRVRKHMMYRDITLTPTEMLYDAYTILENIYELVGVYNDKGMTKEEFVDGFSSDLKKWLDDPDVSSRLENDMKRMRTKDEETLHDKETSTS